MTNPVDKTVLITGAGGGFGRHMVRQFRGAGAKLILTDVSEQALKDAIDDAGDDLVGSFIADLSTEEGCSSVAEFCASNNSAPDILVNNAGVAVFGRQDDVPQERWETLMQLNLLAPMRLCERLLPTMIERGSGHIVNISSIAGWIGSRGLSSYCAAKFGLRGYGTSLAADLDGTGVQVSNVYPCFSRTSILESPQYGFEEQRGIPEWMISDPSDVVAQMIRGMRRNRAHIFPDTYARVIHITARLAPWLLSLIDRRLQAASIEAGKGGN